MQKQRLIQIKKADKGAGICIMDFDDYWDSCMNHLSSKQRQSDGSSKPYYSAASEEELTAAKKEIHDTLKTAFEKKIISEDEFKAMNPLPLGPAKFYQIFKVHKMKNNKLPPERPIVSTCGSFTEKIGQFVQHNLKSLSNIHPSYLQDSPDFLRSVESEINDKNIISDGDILVTVDVSALYTNIPIQEGIEACKELLDKHSDNKDKNDFIIKLLELLLKNNIFEFDSMLYRQIIGTAMGMKPAPDYANIFMAKIDKSISEIADQNKDKFTLKFYKRFLDDIYILFNGSNKHLHEFLQMCNQINPHIKFTITHSTPYNITPNGEDDCECEALISIPFLDTQTTIKNNKIIVDLYRKECDRNMYLLPSSCHPSHVSSNIPFSLALRITRICSEIETRDQRLSELKELLLERDYKAGIIDSNINRAKQIPRSEALKRVEKNVTNSRPVLVITHNPALPSVPKVVQKHWRVMTANPHMKSIFPKPPLVAYKRPPNIGDRLIRAKLPPPPPTRPKRVKAGMHKCNGSCSICPYVKVQKQVKAKHSTAVVQLSKHYDCNTKNIVYILECKKCGDQYIGQTGNSLRGRFLDHLGYARREELNKSTGDHFNLPGHKMSDMQISVLEQVKEANPYYRECRESFHIEQFNLKFKGINRKR